MQVIEKTDYVELVKKYIDIFSALYVPEENWLTTREKEYFIANIFLNKEGIDLASREASLILENKFGFINRGVSIYRGKLKAKGWIIQTASGIELVKAFNYRNHEIPKEVNFNIKVRLKENGQKS
jgi:hypothetical protein